MPLSLLGLVACGAPASDTGASETDPAGPASPWTADVAPDDPPPLDPAAAESALQAILGRLTQLGAAPTMALFDERMSLHDGACPHQEVVDAADVGQNSIFWYAEPCVTGGGTLFDGYSFARTTTDHRTEDGSTWSGSDFKGRISVVDADGARFSVGGDAYVETGLNPTAGAILQRAGMRGAVLWTGAGWEDTSFGQGILSELDMTATWTNAPMLAVQGSAAGFSGAITAVTFSSLVAIDPRLGSACPEELGGSLHARDTTGRWYSLAFDGGATVDAEVDAAACDGCADWTLDGVTLGSVCLDPSAMLAWERYAW